MTVTYGADEAGRGPILGPMAIAVVGLDRKASLALRRLGVADSKAFGSTDAARERRAALDEAIRKHAPCVVLELVPVDVIDSHTFRGQLNALERLVVTRLLERAQVERTCKIICDGKRMFEPLRSRFPNLRAVDGAEDKHLAVAAASIVAKHARDAAFAEIAARYTEEFGPVHGGGYLNAATRRFLEAYRARHGDLPPEARRSWGAPKQVELALEPA